jgi:hypothetical protein
MEDATRDCAAFDEAVVFLSHFKDLKDPRQQGKVTYPLDEILLLCLFAVLAGAETVVDIALFGCKKRELLRRLRPFKDGTPAHDHLGDILAVLDAEQFQSCFVAWVAALTGAPEGVIAIDGKTSRRSGRKAGGNPPIHMVSAFAARQRLVLGQVKVADKSNEIIAIPKLRANACSLHRDGRLAPLPPAAIKGPQRCPAALPQCQTRAPVLTPSGDGRMVACHNPW